MENEKKLIEDVRKKMLNGEYEILDEDNKYSSDYSVVCRPQGYEMTKVSVLFGGIYYVTIDGGKKCPELFFQAKKRYDKIDKEIAKLEKQIEELKRKKAAEEAVEAVEA